MDIKTLQANSLFPVGEENTAYAPYFDGVSYLNMLSLDQVIVGNVTFTPGCRNHWHIHQASQGADRSCWSPPGEGTIRSGASPPGSFTPGTW